MREQTELRNLHILLIVIALIVAVLSRFLKLNEIALHPYEAQLAYQAYQVSIGGSTSLSGQPLYLIFTSILFYLFGASDFLARLVPVIAGTSLVFTPLFAWKMIKPGLMTILIWLLAIDPAAITASHTAGSAIISIACCVWFILFLFKRSWKTAGLFFGLFILSGVSVWWVIIFGLLSFSIWFLISSPEKQTSAANLLPVEKSDRQQFGIWFLVTFLLLGSFFLIIPEGISSFGASITDWINLWTTTSIIPLWMPAIGGLVYFPLVFFFGIAGGVRSLRNQNDPQRIIFIFGLISFLTCIFIPGRALVNLVFLSIPLTILAASEIERFVKSQTEDLLPSIGITVLVLVIVAFLGQVISRSAIGGLDDSTFLITAGGGLIILIISAILAILGWSPTIAGQGYRWAAIIFLFVVTFIGAWKSSPVNQLPELEFWDTGQNNLQDKLLVETLNAVSGWTRGTPTGLDVTIIGRQNASINWLLREQSSVIYGLAFNHLNSPSAVISRDPDDLNLIQLYRGQDFISSRTVNWQEFTASDWLNWVTRRFVSRIEDSYSYLWIRTDLFPGATNSFSGLQQP